MTVRIPVSRAPTHPGMMLLEEFIKPNNLSQQKVADLLDVSYPRLNDLIHGRRGITTDTALRLEALFGVSAEFWLNLQRDWDMYQARQSPETAKRLDLIKSLTESLWGSARRKLPAGQKGAKGAAAKRGRRKAGTFTK